ncbi:MAG: type IV pilus secretin PilQ [Betaproteobacteria bacterium]|jgi:type IV pilus assembly protein PilQ|nr:type IV pilus secretin PilQ [Betaproteobacteria bacterium]
MSRLRDLVPYLLVATLAFLAPAAVRAQGVPNSIDALNVTSQGGQTLLRLELKEPLKNPPASFTVANPARIAFDFPNTINALARTSQDVNEGELRSVNLVQVGERTRVVLNLKSMVTYDTKSEGNTLIISLNAVPSAASRAASDRTVRFAEGTAEDKHSLRDIDFRRGKAGEGRIVVELSDTSTGIDIRQQGQTLVVDFLKTELPDNLRKRLDVTDFATPVTIISTFQQGDNTRMVIEPRGLWEHNAYQTDTQFVVEVKPVQYDPNKLVQGTRGGYKGEKLSLNFQNVEVRSVLNVIADFTDLNIITSDTVQGNLTLRLKDVPWDQALDIILQTRGLDMRKNGNVVWIAPRDELATKEKLELEAKQQISDLEPLRTETFALNFAKADVIAKLLTGQGAAGGGSGEQRILSKRGSASWDDRTNQLFVQDIPSRLDEVRKLIAQTDIPVRQVQIEARIVEAGDNFTRTLGARLGYNVTDASGSSPIFSNPNRALFGGSLNSTASVSGQNTGAFGQDIPNSLMVNLPAQLSQQQAGQQAGQFSLVLFNRSQTRFVNLEITALESDGRAKVISSPRVVTANQVEALIEQGTELPYQQATSSGATSISFRKANLSLKVRPQITPDGNVVLDVDVNKDNVGIQTPAGFAIDTRHVKTSVLIENGGTVVIGGIYIQEQRNDVNKVPLLGDLPGVGPLFRNTQRTDNKTELLVFLTPRIVEERLTVR